MYSYYAFEDVKACGSDGGDIQVRENSTEIRSVNGSSSCRFILPRVRHLNDYVFLIV